MRKDVTGLMFALLVPGQATAADDAELRAYGRHLAAECSACHRIDGIDNGIPSITGWSVEDFINTLRFYKDGIRQNAAMITVAQSLDDTQIRALAVYYASLLKAPRRSSVTPAPAK